MDTLVEVYILAYPPFTVIVANAALAWDPQNRRKMTNSSCKNNYTCKWIEVLGPKNRNFEWLAKVPKPK